MTVWNKKQLVALFVSLCMACSLLPGLAIGASQQGVSAETKASSFKVEKLPAGREALDPSRKLISIGVLAGEDIAGCAIRYKPTADYLASKIDGYRFAVIPIRFEDFHAAVLRKKVDFIFCSPLLYVQLQAISEVSVIATVREYFDEVYFSQLGGVIFCREGRRDIENIEDIRGKSFAAVSEDSFSGWIVGEVFLLGRGIDVKKDASSFKFLETHAGVVRAVQEGASDVGTVRAGTLERMAKAGTINMSDYRIFATSKPSSIFPFYSSTRLYPEWTFAKTNSVSNLLARRVATALYEMPEKSKAARRGRYAGWVVPSSYQSVRECIQDSREHVAGGHQGVVFSIWEMAGLFGAAAIFLMAALFYVVFLKRKMRASNLLMGHCSEAVHVKEEVIHDLKQRIALVAGEKHEDLNVIRDDYQVMYVTPDWEAKYGSGVGMHCYEYFADQDEPCEYCGLREAIGTQKVSTVKKSLSRESGRPMEVKTIPLGQDEDGRQLFGQTYSDVLIQNRKANLSAISQERETCYLLLYGAIQKAGQSPGNAVEALYGMRRLISSIEPPQKIDFNRVVQNVIEQIKHAWEHLAKVTFDPDPERPMIWAVEQDVQIVIANLILNAVRCLEFGAFSTARNGRIILSTQLQGDSLILMVIDDGDLQAGMNTKELFAEPGRAENSRQRFIKVGLLPTYDRVFEKWNGKLQFHRTDGNRNVRTLVVQAVLPERMTVVSSISDESEVPDMNLAENS